MKYTRILLLPLIIATSLNCMEPEQWKIVKTFDQPGYVRAINISRDARILAASSGGKSHLLNMASGKEILSFDNKDGVRAISINKTLVATGDGTIARVRDIENAKEIYFSENKNKISATKLHDNDLLLAVAANHTARLFDLRTNKRIISIQHQDQPVSVCFNNNDNQVVTASFNKVRVFDTRKIEKKLSSIRRTGRFMISILNNANNGIVTVETPFATTWEPGDNTATVETPKPTLQFYNATSEKTIDTGVDVIINPYAGAIDYYYNHNELLFSIDLHQEGKLLAFGLNGKALIFAQKNQQ